MMSLRVLLGTLEAVIGAINNIYLLCPVLILHIQPPP